jgi:hypothetical protein
MSQKMRILAATRDVEKALQGQEANDRDLVLKINVLKYELNSVRQYWQDGKRREMQVAYAGR